MTDEKVVVKTEGLIEAWAPLAKTTYSRKTMAFGSEVVIGDPIDKTKEENMGVRGQMGIVEMLDKIDYLMDKLTSDKISKDIDASIDQVCDGYLTSSPEIRQAVRENVKQSKKVRYHLVGGYAYRACEKFKETKDSQWLNRALAAVSMEDCVVDPRDSLVTLGVIFKAANKKGQDPWPFFNKIGEISGEEEHYEGWGTTKNFILEFKKSAHLESKSFQGSENGFLSEIADFTAGAKIVKGRGSSPDEPSAER